MEAKSDKTVSKIDRTIYDQISDISIQRMFHLLRNKKLLLIRPKVTGDAYTELGSYNWAGLVKQRALDLGWDVTDLAMNDASRDNVEDKINDIKPNLIIHYDHGGSFTLWGQEADSLEAAIDSMNVGLLANRIISTVSCQSASGLGPLAIANGATSYLGYDENHTFVTGYQDRFGEAANAANYALLECKSLQEAYQAGLDAYDDLYNDLIASGTMNDLFAANWVLHDRDCFELLGSSTADACPAMFQLHCRTGLPDSPVQILCRSGLPDSYVCRTGLPDSVIQCTSGLPELMVVCKTGLPDSPMCAAGPNIHIDRCAAGPMMTIDPRRVREQYRKPLAQLEKRMRLEK
ncbi:MAG: hypothetical protein ACXQTE_05690 [Methanosarcinaceae archaeon]